MKILKITPWYPTEIKPLLGSFVQDQALALMKEGIDIGVLFVDTDFRDIFKKIKSQRFKTIYRLEEGVKVFRYYGFFPPKITLSIFKKWILFFDILFEAYVQKFGYPDLLHAHTYYGAYVADYLSKKHQIPFVATEHSSHLLENGIKGWKKKILQSSFNNAAQVISVSKGLKEMLDQLVTKEIIIIPNLIDTELFALNSVKKKNQYVQLISVGDLYPRKGYHFLIEAFSKIAPSIKKNLRLKIIGGGPEHHRLKQLIQKYEANEQIILLGEYPRNLVAQELQMADIFILPSSFETFGIVVIEAMAIGLPVISTRCFGPEDILTPQSGILIPTKDVAEMTLSMEKMYLDYTKYNPKEIRQHVLEHYDEKVIASKLITLYKKILHLDN